MNTSIQFEVFDSFPVLETGRLILRDFSRRDIHDLFQIRSDPKVMEFMGCAAHQSMTDSEEMIFDMLGSFSNKSGINWAIENKHSGKMIGYIGFWRLWAKMCGQNWDMR
jgi:[ribosomal protein S5]-alanine N-acetyltransferase